SFLLSSLSLRQRGTERERRLLRGAARGSGGLGTGGGGLPRPPIRRDSGRLGNGGGLPSPTSHARCSLPRRTAAGTATTTAGTVTTTTDLDGGHAAVTATAAAAADVDGSGALCSPLHRASPPTLDPPAAPPLLHPPPPYLPSSGHPLR
ncbi:Os03g0772300, partial [Oryza sativa Japonica Group]